MSDETTEATPTQIEPPTFDIIVFSNVTGIVVRTMNCTMNAANEQLKPGQAWILGSIDPTTHIVHPGLQFIIPHPAPPEPSPPTGA